MLQLAMASFWHVHAKDYARQAEEHPHTTIAAVWDELPERGRKEAEARGARYYERLEDLLADDSIDGIIVDTPTTLHREVILAAAKAGKHIFTEKVLAVSLKEAKEILQTVAAAGVKLTVSLPRLNEGYTQAIRQILAEGLLGEITLVRTRLSHNGATAGWLPEHFFNREQCGGGAMIDLGCHPMYLTRLFLGMPDTVSATYGYLTGKEVEDNAVSVLSYDKGSIGIVEAGFVNPHSPFTIEIHGTEGSLLYGTPDNRILIHTSRKGENNSKEWQVYDHSQERLPSAFEQWIDHIRNGTTADDNLAIALDLTKLMEASNLSVQRKQAVRITSLAE